MTIVVAGGETIFRKGVLSILRSGAKVRCCEVLLPTNLIGKALEHNASAVVLGPPYSSQGQTSFVAFVSMVTSELPDVSVITIGASAGESDDELYEAGADVSLSAAVSPRELLETIRFFRGGLAPRVSKQSSASLRRAWARHSLATHFSLEELQILAFDLGHNYQNFRHDTLITLSLDLTREMAASGHLDVLIAKVQELRPHLVAHEGASKS